MWSEAGISGPETSSHQRPPPTRRRRQASLRRELVPLVPFLMRLDLGSSCFAFTMMACLLLFLLRAAEKFPQVAPGSFWERRFCKSPWGTPPDRRFDDAPEGTTTVGAALGLAF